jgi:hypothetical protein
MGYLLQLETAQHRHRAIGFLALSLAAAAMLALSIFLASRSAPPQALRVELETASGGALSESGITLLPPPPDLKAVVPQGVAEEVASDEGRGAPIQEVVLARLVAEEQGIDQLAWVVSLDPDIAGLPPMAPVHGEWVNDFALVFVDAQTGDVLFATSRGHMVGP